MNEDLINSAVQFLRDPGVGQAPLTKRVEFLESKGLNQQEVEEALRRASGESTAATTLTPQASQASQAPAAPQAPAPPIDYYGVSAPQVPERDWKDYFIMASATAGVAYGLYQVFTRYLLPTIVPPSLESIEQDKQAIDEEFAKIDKVLDQLAEDQAAMKEANSAKLGEVDVVIENVNDFLSKYNKDKLKFDDDMRLMKLEIDNLSNSIEKNMGFTKNNIKDELADINEELKSLKSLIKTRAEQQSGGPPRKITPVSSIPSASEILKRNMAKKDDKKDEPKQEPKQEKKPELSPSVSVGNVTAGGIPSWQMKHKEAEEKETKPKAAENGSNGSSAGPATGSSAGPAPSAGPATGTSAQPAPEANTPAETTPSGIPAWQLNATDKAADEKVKDTLKNVGVPAWQLNQAPSNSAPSNQ
ncbi:peroxisomal membrane protein Pex14p [Diutina catenulata]